MPCDSIGSHTMGTEGARQKIDSKQDPACSGIGCFCLQVLEGGKINVCQKLVDRMINEIL